MKTILISSVVLAGLVAAAPASAQFAATGDSIFGREYRAETSTKAPDTQDLAIGYSTAAGQESTGSVKAVTDQARHGTEPSRAKAVSIRDENLDARR